MLTCNRTDVSLLFLPELHAFPHLSRMQATDLLICVNFKRSGVVSLWKNARLCFGVTCKAIPLDYTKDVITSSFIGLQLITSNPSSIRVQQISAMQPAFTSHGIYIYSH